MLISNGDGTYTAGSYDVLGIVKNTDTGRFHVYFWEERPPPGPYDPSPNIVRLRSKMHHTEGAETFDIALEHVRQIQERVRIPEENVWKHLDQVILKSFSQEGPVENFMVPSWKGTKFSFERLEQFLST